MNTIQLEKILKFDKETQKYFLGVFARDKLPLKIRFPSCLVFNTDRSNKGGEHWLAIVFTKDKKCEFFDSLGLPPEFYNLNRYIENKCNSYIYSKKPIQGLSFYCGYYCFLFLLTRFRKISFNKFLEFFSDNQKDNDDLIANFIKKFKR